MEPVAAPASTAVTNESSEFANGSNNRHDTSTVSENVERTEQKPAEAHAQAPEVVQSAELSTPSMDHVSDVKPMGLLKQVEATQEKLVEAMKATESEGDGHEVTSSSVQPQQQPQDEADSPVSEAGAQQKQPSQKTPFENAAETAVTSEPSGRMDTLTKEDSVADPGSQQATERNTAPTASATVTSEARDQVDVRPKEAAVAARVLSKLRKATPHLQRQQR